MVPGTHIDTSKKGFEWKLTSFTESEMSIKFLFNEPTSISFDKPDTMVITFENTPIYLIPEDKNRLPIPNGYKLTVPLPVQQISDTVNENFAVED